LIVGQVVEPEIQPLVQFSEPVASCVLKHNS